MEKKISRKTILLAIRNEPLKPLEWVQLDGMIPVTQEDCPVCAIGATLRRAGFSNDEIHDFGGNMNITGICTLRAVSENSTVEKELVTLLKGQRYLHALSLKFEDQASRTGGGKTTRRILSEFVKKNFPNRIKLDPSL